MKAVVIYHSYTGNTRMIAKQIQKALGCDIVELQPVKPFSKDYQEVVDEWQNNSIKSDIEIKDVGADLSQYDVVILGSPIWWYTITPVVTAFLKKYDLSGKKVYPFMTSAGWFGHSKQDVMKLCKKADIQKELFVTFAEDYNSHAIASNKKDIENWIKNIK